MTHMLMCHGGVLKSQALSLRQQLATYFSALVHDFEHQGVNNDFLVHNLLCPPARPIVLAHHASPALTCQHGHVLHCASALLRVYIVMYIDSFAVAVALAQPTMLLCCDT